MNQKIFAALLLIPVAVFATDRIVTTGSDGGGKEKHRTTTQRATPTTATAAESPNEEVKVATLNTPEPQQAVRLDTREAVEEIRALLDSLDDRSNVRLVEWEPAYVYANSDQIGSDSISWLLKHVTKPLKEANPMTISLDRAFSRCPSGYHVEVAMKDGRPTNEGLLIVDDGCWDRRIGIFRYDMITNRVEVEAGDRLGYLPLDHYLKLLKAATA